MGNVNPVLGNLIGEGDHRRVYDIPGFPDMVLKVEKNPQIFANVAEWLFWLDAGTDLKPWLCPCVAISDCGKRLLMRRAKPILELPEMIPACLKDRSLANFGLYEGRVVCLDYASYHIVKPI